MRYGSCRVLALAALTAAVVAGCVRKGASPVAERTGAEPFAPAKNPGNAAFYRADGAFDADAAKESYYEMMRAYAYPVTKLLRSGDFWVCDFVQRDYEKLGMAGIFWTNVSGKYGTAGTKAYAGDFKDTPYGYLGHEIYLLPGQTLPEHRHVGGEKGYGPKMETWHVRYGSATFYGEHKGAGDEKPIGETPESERPWGAGQDWFRSKYSVKRSAGELYMLEDPESWHGIRAGPNGAIVSEYATFHNQVEFSKPGMVFASSEARK